MGPALARDAPASTLRRPSWLWICSLRFQETAFPDQPRVTVAPSDFRRKRALYARRLFRHSAGVLTPTQQNLSLHSQFGPLPDVAWEGIVGRRRVFVDGRPGREHELDTPQLELGSASTQHTHSPTKADLNAHTRKQKRRFRQPRAGSPNHDCHASKTLLGINALFPPTTTTTTTASGEAAEPDGLHRRLAADSASGVT